MAAVVSLEVPIQDPVLARTLSQIETEERQIPGALDLKERRIWCPLPGGLGYITGEPPRELLSRIEGIMAQVPWAAVSACYFRKEARDRGAHEETGMGVRMIVLIAL